MGNTNYQHFLICKAIFQQFNKVINLLANFGIHFNKMTEKPKVLIVPGYKLFPYETGAGVAQYNFIDAIRDHVQLSVLLSSINVHEADRVVLERKWPNVTFHYWSDSPSITVIPSIGRRIVNKLNSMIGYEKRDELVERSQKYQQIHYNIENIMLPSPSWMVNGLRELLDSQDFDLVQFDLPINMGLASVVAGRAKTLFVHHEVKFQRIATSLIGDEENFEDLLELQRSVEKVELELLESFDAVQVFSPEDKELLKDKLERPIYVCPFALADSQFIKPQDNESLERLIFIGSDEHEPNLDAIQWFIQEWMVDFPKEYNLPIHIIGKWSDENKLKFTSESVHFEGFVDSLAPWFRNSALLAPIRSGAGLRTKIMEAMAMSTPVIATKFASQGLGAGENEILFAETGID
jgi:glycosyltransferase involved in cell wall biosynthesis